MAYSIWVLGESQVSISGGGQLDGVTQGDGSHLAGRTLTLNSNAWTEVQITDNDANFQDSDSSQRLDGTQTIDGVTYTNNPVVEAEYGFVVSDGTNTYTLIGFNVNNSSPAYGTVEGLAFVGGPGQFPPVGVPLTVVSTFEGPSFAATDYVTPICFAEGTKIATPKGPVPIERLARGALVETLQHGPQPIRWIGGRQAPLDARAAPVRFQPGVLGNSDTLIVSPQHRMFLSGWRAELLFGEAEVLVAAKDFVDGKATLQDVGRPVRYFHMLFERHEIVFAEGVPSESLHPGPVAIDSLAQAAKDELSYLFPDLHRGVGGFGPSAARKLKRHEARALLAA